MGINDAAGAMTSIELKAGRQFTAAATAAPPGMFG